jgi:hypothetical protein
MKMDLLVTGDFLFNYLNSKNKDFADLPAKDSQLSDFPEKFQGTSFRLQLGCS